LKLDENVTIEAADVLRRFGHDGDAVAAEGLRLAIGTSLTGAAARST
jgi:hypothetical protein